jgi:hypothetical protein
MDIEGHEHCGEKTTIFIHLKSSDVTVGVLQQSKVERFEESDTDAGQSC